MFARLRNTLVAVVMCAVVASCSGTGRSVEMHDTERSVWATTEDFVYDNVDTLARRDISVVVRYGTGNIDNAVALTILSIAPDSMVVAEPFTLHIPPLGDMRPKEHTFIYRRNVVLSQRGEYLFRLQPSAAVEGISSVGIVITEPEVEK